MSTHFQDNFWLAKLSFLLEHKVAKGYNVFAVAGKVQAFKEMLKLWQSKVLESGFSDFKCLQKFFQTNNWEIEDTNLK